MATSGSLSEISSTTAFRLTTVQLPRARFAVRRAFLMDWGMSDWYNVGFAASRLSVTFGRRCCSSKYVMMMWCLVAYQVGGWIEAEGKFFIAPIKSFGFPTELFYFCILPQPRRFWLDSALLRLHLFNTPARLRMRMYLNKMVEIDQGQKAKRRILQSTTHTLPTIGSDP